MSAWVLKKHASSKTHQAALLSQKTRDGGTSLFIPNLFGRGYLV